MRSSKKKAADNSLYYDLASLLSHYNALGQNGLGDIILCFLTISDLESLRLTHRAFQHPNTTLTMLKQFAIDPKIAGKTVLSEGYVSYVCDSKEMAREKIKREIHYPTRKTAVAVVSDGKIDIQNKIKKMQDLLMVALQCDLNNMLKQEAFEELLSEPYFQVLTTSMFADLEPDLKSCFKKISLKLSEYLCEKMLYHQFYKPTDYTSEQASVLKLLVDSYNKLPFKEKLKQWYDNLYISGYWAGNPLAAEILFASNICEPSHFHLFHAAKIGDAEGLKVILKYFKGNINHLDDARYHTTGWTALIYAAFNNRLECVKLLLAAGADTSIKAYVCISDDYHDYYTATEVATHHAAIATYYVKDTASGYNEIVRLLKEADIRNGINPPAQGSCVVM